MADERTYTEAELQQRLQFARDVGAERAWRDVLRRFTPAQRRHIANLLAHDWTLTAIEMQDRYGSSPRRTDGGVSLEDAVKALDEEKAKRRAAPIAGVLVGDAAQAATRTLERMGYSYHGAELWKPPIGPRPAWVDAADGEPEYASWFPVPAGVEATDPVRGALRDLVAVLREYGTFPPKVIPALQTAERALGVDVPRADQQKGGA
jgi:hypothetical protein